MGKIRPVKQVKLFAGIIASGEAALLAAEKEVETTLGKISLRSEIIPFDHTEYYKAEMGEGLLRRWVGFEKTRFPSDLAPAKVAANAIEAKFAENGGGRTGRFARLRREPIPPAHPFCATFRVAPPGIADALAR